MTKTAIERRPYLVLSRNAVEGDQQIDTLEEAISEARDMSKYNAECDDDATVFVYQLVKIVNSTSRTIVETYERDPLPPQSPLL